MPAPSAASNARQIGPRQPLAATLIGVVCLVALAGFTGITLAWRQAEAASQTALGEAAARQEAYRAEALQRGRVERQLYFSNIALADRELRSHKPAWALHWLAQCPASLRQWEWHYLMRAARNQGPSVRTGHKGGISSLAFDRQGALPRLGQRRRHHPAVADRVERRQASSRDTKGA